jgi:carbon storage regulator
MLIITRRDQEEIVIDKNIFIKILGFDKKYIKLGITAPLTVQVHRKEIQERIDNNIPFIKKNDD